MGEFKEFYHDYNNQKIIELYVNSKGKIKEIAQQTDTSIGEIYRILHGYNITPNRLKINHSNVLEFANSGLSISQIAELTGYTSRNVRYILSNRR